VKSLSNM